jgi:hypothetical protein
MRLLDGLFTRRRRLPRLDDVSVTVRRRLEGACRELTEAEDRMAAELGIADQPRLLLIDEEEAVVIGPDRRAVITDDEVLRRD